MTTAAEMEPMLPSGKAIDASQLPDKVVDLERKAATLNGMVNAITRQVITDHMRIINSYYSNLIEGNNTHPREIRKAMEGYFSKDPLKRNLQKESIAHIEVQKYLEENPPSLDQLNTPDFIKTIHFQFYKELPGNLRIVRSPKGRELEVVPGQFRQANEEVEIGIHLPPGGEYLEHFFRRFTEAYNLEHIKGYKRVIAAMAAHHRLTWIHPFLDGNGRVGRLHTDTFLKSIGVGGYGIWCISRGLAKKNKEYKAALAYADYPRQGDLDGRGALSEKNLVTFIEFMLDIAIDQVEYMSSLLDLRGMGIRIKAYIEDRNKGIIPNQKSIKPEAVNLLEKAFMYGEFPRSEMEAISGLGLSVTRKLVQQLKEEGLLTETSSRSPLRWAIPAHAERYYFPELAIA